MPAPRWLKLCWTGSRACLGAVWGLIVWTLWLGLSIVLVFQLWVATQRELSLPQFALRQIEERLAASGLRATFGQARFDPTGHILLEDLRLWLGRLPDPVLSARSVHVELDPWALLLREVEIERIHLHGGQLLVPAMLSLTGQQEALVDQLELQLEADSRQQSWRLQHLSARAGKATLQADGQFGLARRARPARPAEQWLAEATQAYVRWIREISSRVWSLDEAEGLHLAITFLAPAAAAPTVEIAAEAQRLPLPPSLTGRPEALELQGLVMKLRLPLPGENSPPSKAVLQGRLGQFAAEAWGKVSHAHFRGEAELGPRLGQPVGGNFDLIAKEFSFRDWSVSSPTLHVGAQPGPALDARLVTRLAGEPWQAEVTANLPTRSGELTWTGRVSSRLLAEAGRIAGRDVAALLQWEQSPETTGRARWQDGKPLDATTRVASGPVVARGVALDAASGMVQWRADDHSLVAEDIRLVTGASEARGRYVMNTQSRDFRFLLSGHLQPAAINGWFREWWPNFWSQFDFREAPPSADVDVRGQWGRPELTNVFVVADGATVALRGAAFERIRTRIFVRPGHTDVLDFVGDRAGRTVRGSFTHGFNLETKQWTRVTFAAHGNTDLAPVAQIFGSFGKSIVAPFAFDSPPRLHARGFVENATATKPRRIQIAMAGAADGDWTFHLFPLHSLEFRATLEDETLLIDDLRAGFAGGRARGRLELSGFSTDRRLAFDANLTGSRLGESIRTLELWSAQRNQRPPTPASRFQRQVAGGQLDLALSAEGRFDDPFSLNGQGNATISGADLGEINLLGILSSLLRPTFLNFTTLQLDSAQANFTLAGPVLDFRELRLVGPRAAIDAHGTYRLDRGLLNIAAKVRPFDTPGNLLAATFGVVLTPLTNVLEVRLTGPLEQPAWAFAYGPTNLLRSLAGESSAPPPAATQEAGAAPVVTDESAKADRG
jgi:hypothetical protein